MKLKHSVILLIAAASLAVAGCKGNAKIAKNTAPVEIKQAPKPSLPEAKRVEFNDYFFNANKEKAIGNYTLALEYLIRCSRLDPYNHAVAYLTAEIFHLSQKNQEAERWIDKAIALNDSNPWYYRLAASIAEGNRNYAKAVKYYQNLLRLDDQPENYFSLANALIYNREIDKAIAVYDDLEKKFGVSEDVVEQKEQLYLLTGRIDKAIEEVNKLVKTYPENTKFRGMLAELYLKKGDLKQAKAIYEEALAQNPQDGRAHFGMAEIYRRQEQREKMFFHLNAGFEDPSIDVNEKSKVLYSIVPVISKDTTLVPELIRLSEKLSISHPDNPSAQSLFGDVLFNFERFEQALVPYKKSRALKKENISTYQQIILCYEGLNRYDSMAQEAEYALEYFPNQILLYYLLAGARMQLKQYEKAAAAAEMALEIGAVNDDLEVLLWSMAGDANYFLKKYEKSDAAYESGLAIDPNNVYILNNYAYFLSVRKVNLEKALRMSKKTVDKEPENPTYLDTYGWIFFQMGDYENAYTYLFKAITLKPDDPEVLEHFGDVLFKLGKTDEAFVNWQKARENGSDSKTLEKKMKEKKWVE